MKRSSGIGARSIVWTHATATKGLAPVWVSRKAYDVVAAVLIKAAKEPYIKQLLKARLAPLRLDIRLKRRGSGRALAAEDKCDYIVTPSPEPEISGMVPVWLPIRTYDVFADLLMPTVKGEYGRKLLRRRAAPMGLDATCGGTCGGGWCKERELPGEETSAAYVCECQYFV